MDGNNNINDDEEWEVEDILDMELRDGVIHYLVKWRGFDHTHNRFVPIFQMNSPELIRSYEMDQLLQVIESNRINERRNAEIEHELARTRDAINCMMNVVQTMEVQIANQSDNESSSVSDNSAHDDILENDDDALTIDRINGINNEIDDNFPNVQMASGDAAIGINNVNGINNRIDDILSNDQIANGDGAVEMVDVNVINDEINNILSDDEMINNDIVNIDTNIRAEPGNNNVDNIGNDMLPENENENRAEYRVPLRKVDGRFICTYGSNNGQECGQSYATSYNARRHIARNHLKNQRRTCSTCHHTFPHSENYRAHRRDVHHDQ